MGLVDYTNYDDMKYAIRKLDDTEFRNPFARAYIRVKSYEGSVSRSRSRSHSRSRSRSRTRSRSRSPRRNKSKSPARSPSRSRSKSVSRSRSASPARLSRSRSISPRPTIFRNPNKIKPYVVPNPERCNVPAAAIFASSDSVIIVDVNAPDAHVALHKWKPNTPDSHGTPFLFQHGKATHGSAGGALMRMLKGPAGDWQFPQALAFPTSGIRSSAVVAATCDKEIITGGHADNSVKLISSDGAITIETAARHCAPVTCLALSPDSNHLVTGSQDTTLILWRIHRAPLSQLSNISKSSTSAATTACTNSPHSGRDLSNIVDTSRRSRIEGPLQVLRGHLKAIIYHTLKLKDGQDITSVALNKDNTNLLVSTADKQLIIFTDPDLSLNAGQMLPSNLEGNNLTPHSK